MQDGYQITNVAIRVTPEDVTAQCKADLNSGYQFNDKAIQVTREEINAQYKVDLQKVKINVMTSATISTLTVALGDTQHHGKIGCFDNLVM